MGSAPAEPISIVVCAWLLGGHRWRTQARWDWRTSTLRLVEERCSRCHLTRPSGGYFAAARLGFPDVL